MTQQWWPLLGTRRKFFLRNAHRNRDWNELMSWRNSKTGFRIITNLIDSSSLVRSVSPGSSSHHHDVIPSRHKRMMLSFVLGNGCLGPQPEDVSCWQIAKDNLGNLSPNSLWRDDDDASLTEDSSEEIQTNNDEPKIIAKKRTFEDTTSAHFVTDLTDPPPQIHRAKSNNRSFESLHSLATDNGSLCVLPTVKEEQAEVPPPIVAVPPPSPPVASSTTGAASPLRVVEHARIGGHSVDHLLKFARTIVDLKTSNSKIRDVKKEEMVPRFERSEIFAGLVLGRGNYSIVSEVRRITLSDENSEHDFPSGILDGRVAIQANYQSGKNKFHYAIKMLKKTDDKNDFVNGVVDLAIEANLLAVLSHPHICNMVAMSEPFQADSFLILDRLYDTLDKRMMKWKRQQPVGLRKAIVDRGGQKTRALWIERLSVAYDVASALTYLHSMRVMYRDLKPDNVAFDSQGEVKLFDFGLAKEFGIIERDKNGNFLFTADTGNPRFMAPEVALGKPYNETADVYSFCLFLWQIIALDTAFDKFTLTMLRRKVVLGGMRPPCDPKWPSELVRLIRKGWSEKASERPSMKEVGKVIQDELARNRVQEGKKRKRAPKSP